MQPPVLTVRDHAAEGCRARCDLAGDGGPRDVCCHRIPTCVEPGPPRALSWSSTVTLTVSLPMRRCPASSPRFASCTTQGWASAIIPLCLKEPEFGEASETDDNGRRSHCLVGDPRGVHLGHGAPAPRGRNYFSIGAGSTGGAFRARCGMV